MTASTRKTKLLFMLTDGYFNSDMNDATIQRMNKLGVDTTIVFLSYNAETIMTDSTPEELNEMRHEANNFIAITKPLDLVKVAKAVVRNHLVKGKK